MTLKDQFGTRPAKTVRLVMICNPVRKQRGSTVTKIRRPREHLACYSITETRRMLARRVVLRNQFERPRLRAVRIRWLCLPSLKQDL